MVHMTSLSTSIAWGLPVRPDLLGQSLHAYSELLPTLTALRLCHRYGAGPDAYITKLPTELLSSIEGLIFQDQLAKHTSWIDHFRHFESRCAPSEHFGAIVGEVWADIESESYDKLCEECRRSGARKECTEGCYKAIDDAVQSALAEEPDYRFDECNDMREKWAKMIDQRPTGDFKVFDELLRKHFGLEAYFATTRPVEENPGAWPDDPNHEWEFMDVLQTTTCYITLPRRQPKAASFSISEFEADSGYAYVQGAQSSLVRIPPSETSSLRAKQFNHMLRTLRLKPYVHESQLLDHVTADADADEQEPTTKLDHQSVGTSQTIQSKGHDHQKIQWPQLVVLTKTQFTWPL